MNRNELIRTLAGTLGVLTYKQLAMLYAMAAEMAEERKNEK